MFAASRARWSSARSASANKFTASPPVMNTTVGHENLAPPPWNLALVGSSCDHLRLCLLPPCEEESLLSL